MGCGSSSMVSPDGENGQMQTAQTKSHTHSQANGQIPAKKDTLPSHESKPKPQARIDKNSNKLKTIPPQAPGRVNLMGFYIFYLQLSYLFTETESINFFFFTKTNLMMI